MMQSVTNIPCNLQFSVKLSIFKAILQKLRFINKLVRGERADTCLDLSGFSSSLVLAMLPVEFVQSIRLVNVQ